MTISVRLNEEDTKLIRKYAQLNNISLSDLIRNSIIEKIEDEYDLESYEKSMEEYRKNPKKYTLDDAKKELGLQWNIKLS